MKFSKVLLRVLLLALAAYAADKTLSTKKSTKECRKCLESYSNSYYCTASGGPQGTCCPFPTSRIK